MPALTATRARTARLTSLLLADHSLRSPAEIVAWFGAMQAQDAASVVWSLGLRLPGTTEAAVLTALANHEILRTWPMRGTIHLVPSADAAWMLALTGSKTLPAGARRREQLGLTLADAETATAALADALAGAHLLTRAQALAVINDAGIATDGQRGYHLLLFAAQTGVICIGPQVDGGQTFVLLDEWAPHQRRLDAREGAAELAYRYFRSHGPTTVADFAGWTGLGLGVSRQAIADNEGRLVPAESAGETVWFAPEALEESSSISATHVLPGFDEFMLGYKDRSLHVPEGRFEAVVPGGNGVFRSTVVTRGVVEGTWTRTLTATTVKVTVEPFAAPSAARRAAMERTFETYAAFLDRRLALTVREPIP